LLKNNAVKQGLIILFLLSSANTFHYQWNTLKHNFLCCNPFFPLYSWDTVLQIPSKHMLKAKTSPSFHLVLWNWQKPLPIQELTIRLEKVNYIRKKSQTIAKRPSISVSLEKN